MRPAAEARVRSRLRLPWRLDRPRQLGIFLAPNEASPLRNAHYSADELIAIHRQRNGMRTAAPRKAGPFRHSIHRRG
jgi:hypothetical protein